jgi:hypothetical protein
MVDDITNFKQRDTQIPFFQKQAFSLILKEYVNDEELAQVLTSYAEESKKGISISFSQEKKDVSKEPTVLQKILNDKKLELYVVLLNLEALKLDKNSVLAKRMLSFSKHGLVPSGIQIGQRYLIYWLPDSVVHWCDLQQDASIVAIREKVGDVQLSDVNLLVKLERLCGACATYCKEDRFSDKRNNCHHFTENVLRRVYFSEKIKFPGQLGMMCMYVVIDTC